MPDGRDASHPVHPAPAAHLPRMKPTISFQVSLSTDVNSAIEHVTSALKAEGFGVLTRIDVDKTLKEKIGADFRRYTILGACNPTLAHRALSHRGEIGLLLPCNVTVEATDDDRALVSIGNPAALLATPGIEGDAELSSIAQEARERLERVAAALEADA